MHARYGALVLLTLAFACNNSRSTTGATPSKPAAAKGGTQLAKVGDDVITVEDFEEKINAQGPFARPRFADPARRKEFLEGLIRQELLAQEAQRRGFDQDPEVQDALKKVMVQKLTRLEYDSLVKQEDIKAEDIKKYYDSHPDEFHKPEMVRCSAALVGFGPDAKSKDAAKKRAESGLKRIKDQAGKKVEPGKPLPPDVFRDVVLELSDDAESKALAGDLKYLSAEELTEKYGKGVADACFALPNVNDLSGVVEGKTAYAIMKNTGRRKPIDRTLEQVETQVRNRLFREKRTEAFNTFVDNLKVKSPVSVDEARLANMKIAAGAPPGSAVPGALAPPSNLAPGAGEAQAPTHEKAPSHDEH